MTAKGEKMVTTHVTLPETLLDRLRKAHAKIAAEDGHVSFSQAIRIVLMAGLRSLRK